MLKAYAVAVALSTTAPAGATTDVENKPVDSASQKTESNQVASRELLVSSESVNLKKGYRRRGLIIVMP